MSDILYAAYMRAGKTSTWKLMHQEREYTLCIRVVCSDADYDHLELISTVDAIPAPPGGSGGSVTLPVLGTSTYPTDTGALCVGWSVSQTAAGGSSTANAYDITYSYSSNPPIPSDRIEDPTSRPVVWRTTWRTRSVARQQDLDGNAVVNSAGQPFESPVFVNMSVPIYEATQNYALDASPAVHTLVDSINLTDWTPTGLGGITFEALSCYMESITIEPVSESGTNYLQAKYRFTYDDELYQPYKVLDCGYNTLSSGVLVELKAKNGSKLQKPKLLDGMGGEP